MKAYIAAPIFNPDQLKVVGEIYGLLLRNGFDPFSPYEASRPIWNGRAPKDCTAEERRQVLNQNIDNLHCDLVVSWVGGSPRTDVGVAWEMGYAHCLSLCPRGARPYTVAYIDDTDARQDMNLMLAETVDWLAVGLHDLAMFLSAFATRNAPLDRWHPSRRMNHESEAI